MTFFVKRMCEYVSWNENCLKFLYSFKNNFDNKEFQTISGGNTIHCLCLYFADSTRVVSAVFSELNAKVLFGPLTKNKITSIMFLGYGTNIFNEEI